MCFVFFFYLEVEAYMFLLIAFVIDHQGQWSVKRLPVLEWRTYDLSELVDKVHHDMFKCYKHVWITKQAVPIKYGAFNELEWGAFSTTQWLKQIAKLGRKWAIKFMHVTTKGDAVEQCPLPLQLREIEASLEQLIKGKLLHLYEFQKGLRSKHISISLQQCVDIIFALIWCNKADGKVGIEQFSNVSHKFQLPSFLSRKQSRCARCHNTMLLELEVYCESCKGLCLYCDACTQLGKVKSCSFLVAASTRELTLYASTFRETISHLLSPYHLSDAQTEAVTQLLHDINAHYTRINEIQTNFPFPTSIVKVRRLNYLLWAVTGAGKTEMIFPLIHYFRIMKMNILIAIPRRDVVQELVPRISNAFPDCDVVALYGGSEDIWRSGDIYISTTHQLLRFHHYFDLVILDEMDAFPYYNNVTLIRTLQRVQRPHACFIQLTATVPHKEKLKLWFKQQKYVKVPVRFHKQPLPIPMFIKSPVLTEILQSKKLPVPLIALVESSYHRGAVLFVFIQRKIYLQPFKEIMQVQFPHIVIDCTSAEDEAREQKVKQFRERAINVLITTSILERGVTIKKSDICILDVHQRAFNRTAIVQMAGRAGRSAEDPKGNVYLLGSFKTKEVKNAIREIESMNKLAVKKGFIKRGS